MRTALTARSDFGAYELAEKVLLSAWNADQLVCCTTYPIGGLFLPVQPQ